MSDFDLIVVGGLVVTAEEIGEFDIGIKDEKIAEITARGGLASKSATKTIDAKGGYVMVRRIKSKQHHVANSL
jgi:dihydropyrimidinase